MDTWHNVSHVSKLKKKDKSQKERKKEGTDGQSESEKREREIKEKDSLLSKIYGNRTVGFRGSKKQSRSTHRELHMGTKILEFRQTP